MNLFEEIKAGLNEAIEFEKGELKAKKTRLEIAETPMFKPADIKEIRNSVGLTQKLFAKVMGVSVKTVEAWESGRNHPEGPACRLLSLMQRDPNFIVSSGIIVV